MNPIVFQTRDPVLPDSLTSQRGEVSVDVEHVRGTRSRLLSRSRVDLGGVVGRAVQSVWSMNTLSFLAFLGDVQLFDVLTG